MRRTLLAKSVRCLVVSVLFVPFSMGAALAAPRISRDAFHTPAHGMVGEPLLLFAENLATPVTVLFSNGTSPTVAGTSLQVDVARGAILVKVPAGAQTGNMKVTANGVSSPLFFFRVDAGTFTQGTDVVSGKVKNGSGTGVANTLLLLFIQGCNNGELLDYAKADSGGNYTMHGPDGDSQIIAF